MNLDDFGRVAAAALQSIETLLWDWFPNGVVDGNEFCIGSPSGEAGKSMRIRLTGERAGFWKDFSLDDAAGGDLISLYARAKGVSQGKACAAVAQAVGIALSDDKPERPAKSRASKKPAAQIESAPAQAGKGVDETSEKKPRTDWVPILPVPADMQVYPKAHPVRGKPSHTWEYRDQERRLLGIVCRFKTSDGGKIVVPCTFAEHAETKKREWRWISFREPRPLYLPAALRAGFPVLIVEGEKCVDAAYAVLAKTYDVVCWPGGGNAVTKADWAPIAGRKVTIWPDADSKRYKKGHSRAGEIMPPQDQPGTKCASVLAGILSDHGCPVRLVDIPEPGQKEDGWDIADLIAGGGTLDQVSTWLATAYAFTPKHTEPTDDDLPQWVTEPPEGISTASTASADSLSWRQLCELLIKTDRGLVKGCRENVYLALRHDPDLIGIVALDQFAQLQVKRRTTPWRSDPGEWTETDDFQLGLYLAKKYFLVLASIGEIEKAVSQAAREHAFDPVKDYMTACADKWDGVARVERSFSTYWGATDSDYLRLIARMFFVGLVQRAFKPGVKHDHAPVFEGGQGEGKSTALEVLGGEWFADTTFAMGEKDGYLSIQGVLIYEVAELEGFNKAEVMAVKAFMSSKKDRYREPYGRRMKNVPRRTCFAATTNEGQYFKDPTGNRRFWPLTVGFIDLDALTRDRDQIMGEAVHLMRAKVLWYPTREQQRVLIGPQQYDREIPHEWMGKLYDYCEGVGEDGNPISAGKRDRVSSRELITKCLGIEIGKLGAAKRETMDVSTCMRKLGWLKEREAAGAREYYYVRPKPAETVPLPAPAMNREYEPGADFDEDLPI